MNRPLRADIVFRTLPEQIKREMLDIAKGMVVDFRIPINRKKVDEIRVFKMFDNGDSYRIIAKKLKVSRMHIRRIVRWERKMYSKKRIEFWLNQGLSPLGIAAIFNKKPWVINKTIKEISKSLT